ncbi:hypothetical protein [Paludibaculum fermentans]|uniref:Uncharacterized protein n=1 Tax=Paludibaculum fermentans TaxID=1473598 RepID=A0A7S7NU29_PALFE|nr:hypothetical protein [Paludibaculum fermentans]QOY89823.1 hypothetical protein IRI77_07685 [Paludibaculum fermentans]
MTKPLTAQSALALLLMLSSTGCTWFGRKPKAPATPPQPQPVVTAPPVVTPVPEPPPPQPQAQPEPPQPVPAPPQPQPTPVPPKPKPVVTTPKPPAPAPAPPSFGQILSPQQQTELRNSYQQSAQSARQVLIQLKGRALSREQAETANRIRSFLSQADEAQAKDPATAAQLAQRAQILARDLQSALR